mgnify:CR=1 FL=1
MFFVFENLISIFVIEAIGVILAILALTKYKKDNNKILDEIQKTLISIQTTLSFMQTRIERLETMKGIENDERN